ncbi:Nitric oxide oxidoreductase [Elasticomyces elasticus]|nr:Nitric oxide oxidoreductase [Elasticomyces elasticus]
MPLTPDQVKIIKSTVPVLREHGADITKTFYHTLLSDVPSLNDVFNQANQVNNHQANALAGALYAYASHIDDLGALQPAVEKICQKHASLYIKAEQYDIVGKYLLQAMGTVLGAALTKEILDAWAVAYRQLADVMIKREESLLQDANPWTDWRDFVIDRKVKESEEITSFYFVPKDGQPLPKFLPGRYISIKTDVPLLKYDQSRQYSLSDAWSPKYYRISVKKEKGLPTAAADAKYHPGYISNVLHESKSEGDIIQMSHPFGEFFLDSEKNAYGPVVLVSAGVGLTPLLSMLNTLIVAKSRRKISWIHATRGSSVQAFRQHIQKICREHENVHAIVFNKKPEPADVEGSDYHHVGRLALDVLDRERDLFVNDVAARYFICGPEAFMKDMARGLRAFGIDEARIKMELFGTGAILSD